MMRTAAESAAESALGSSNQPSCCDISGMDFGNIQYFTSSLNVYLDSRMNSLDVSRQRSGTLQNMFLVSTQKCIKLMITKFHMNV